MTQNKQLIFNQTQPPVSEISSILQNSKNILVISHMDPDGDSLGTQMALGRYLKDSGKNVVMLRDGNLPEKYLFLKDFENVISYDKFDEEINFDTVVFLECPNIERSGRAVKYISTNSTILNIDHHLDNDKFGEVNWFNVTASSVGEMIYEYFEAVDYQINEDVANYLFTAIMTDTDRFRYHSTSARTMEITAKLIKAGADTQLNCDSVYFNIKQSTMKLTAKVLNSIEFHFNGRLCLLSLTKDMFLQSGADKTESDGLVDYTLYSQGVIVGALIKEIDKNRSKISLRSRDGIDVSKIASAYKGGGHFNAAGFVMNKSVTDAKEELLNILKEVMSDHE